MSRLLRRLLEIQRSGQRHLEAQSLKSQDLMKIDRFSIHRTAAPWAQSGAGLRISVLEFRVFFLSGLFPVATEAMPTDAPGPSLMILCARND